MRKKCDGLRIFTDNQTNGVGSFVPHPAESSIVLGYCKISAFFHGCIIADYLDFEKFSYVSKLDFEKLRAVPSYHFNLSIHKDSSMWYFREKGYGQ